MGTIRESAHLDEMFRAAEAAVEAAKDEGSRRISLSLKVDIRLDRDMTIASKLSSAGRH